MRFFSLTMLILTVVLASSDWLNAAEGLEQQDLFVADQDGYAIYRIPGIVVTAKGTVLAYCEARRTGKSDWDTIDIYMRRSTDGGRTFGERVKVADVAGDKPRNPVAITRKQAQPEDTTYNNPVCIASKEGTVHLLFCLEYMRCFYSRSDDDGISWSTPREITTAFEMWRPQYDWKVLATGPGHGIELQSGRLVVPVWLSLGTEGNGHKPSVTSVVYSDDQGETWQAGDIVARDESPVLNPNETVAVELSDGRVMFNIRNLSLENRKGVSISPNGATEWSPPALVEALVEPICMASIVRRPAKGDRPALVVFANPDNLERKDGKEPPGGGRDRKNVTIQLSRDDGQTWFAKQTLEPGASAYSDLAVLPSGEVLCLYERGREGSSRGAYARLTLARFTIDWVTGPNH
ncbi:MAG: exo-alpha-sialidase [Planctomycetaceae bacterium]